MFELVVSIFFAQFGKSEANVLGCFIGSGALIAVVHGLLPKALYAATPVMISGYWRSCNGSGEPGRLS
jgi:hypothetical protein